MSFSMSGFNRFKPDSNCLYRCGSSLFRNWPGAVRNKLCQSSKKNYPNKAEAEIQSITLIGADKIYRLHSNPGIIQRSLLKLTPKKLEPFIFILGLITIGRKQKDPLFKVMDFSKNIPIPSLPSKWNKDSPLPKAVCITATDLYKQHKELKLPMKIYLDFTKYYNVIEKVINTEKEFWSTLERCVEKKPRLVVISAHGDGNQICSSGNTLASSTSEIQKAADILKKLPFNAIILLLSCSAGIGGKENSENLANWFSKCAPHVRIIAPQNIIAGCTTSLAQTSPLTVNFYVEKKISSIFQNIANIYKSLEYVQSHPKTPFGLAQSIVENKFQFYDQVPTYEISPISKK